MERRGDGPLLRLLAKLGGWPVLQQYTGRIGKINTGTRRSLRSNREHFSYPARTSADDARKRSAFEQFSQASSLVDAKLRRRVFSVETLLGVVRGGFNAAILLSARTVTDDEVSTSRVLQVLQVSVPHLRRTSFTCASMFTFYLYVPSCHFDVLLYILKVILVLYIST